jgi:hypothetical protein
VKEIRIFDLKYNTDFREKFHSGVDAILDAGFISNHHYVKNFEQYYSAFNGSSHSLAVCNATGALEVSYCQMWCLGQLICEVSRHSLHFLIKFILILQKKLSDTGRDGLRENATKMVLS